MKQKIDFVVTWVDGNDKEWQLEKLKYEKSNNNLSKNDSRNIRYRDWDNLKYWFRGVEKFAPWVNKVYFITYGHIPSWLNTSCEKLVIVKHEDYIPKEYLPTFNSNAIEMNMHKIEGLSEQFVYFNDDMFLTDHVSEDDFFINGLPCDACVFSPIMVISGDDFYKKVSNNVAIINKYFDFKQAIKDNKNKYFSIKYGKYLSKSLPLAIYTYFPGFNPFHIPVPYLKSTFKEVWEKEEFILKKTMSFKFRNNEESVNHWLYQYWQFASGKFHPRKWNIGRYIDITNENLCKYIENKKYKITCVNDSDKVIDFEKRKTEINDSFQKILPDKSAFEK